MSGAVPDGAAGPDGWTLEHASDALAGAASIAPERLAASLLDAAVALVGARAGALAFLDRPDEPVVLAARGVDRDALLEDPHAGPLVAAALRPGAPSLGAAEGVRPGPAFVDAAGPHDLLAVALRLRVREGSPADRERRRAPLAPVERPLGALLLACPPGASRAEAGRAGRAALEALAAHAGDALVGARRAALATRDELTGLLRRDELDHQLQVELVLAARTARPLALVMLDIDGLGQVNQAHGRARADRLLARAGRLLAAELRAGDHAFRHGGDAFAVVLPGTDADGGHAGAERLRRALAALGQDPALTASCGVAAFPAHAAGPAELLRKADQALGLAKLQGGDRVVTWHKRIPRHAARGDALVGILTGNRVRDQRNVLLLLDTIVVVGSLLERRKVLGTLVDMMVQLCQADRGVLYLEREGELLPEVALDAQGRPVEVEDPCVAVIDRVGHGGAPVSFLGRDDDDEPELVEACRAHGLGLAIGLPLRVRGARIGAMYFDARGPRPLVEESDLVFMQALARQLGNAIDAARLYQENVEQKEALEALTAQLSLKVQAQASELAHLERNLTQLQTRYTYDRIVGKSEAMQRVFAVLDRVTHADVPVLIQGETGTGKELVARALHLNGPRKAGPFVTVNCSALTESLLESELFGHVRGAFTGADRDKAGLFEQAHGGTIFLDEVQDMSAGMQRELLRVLQEGEVRRVGGKDVVHVDVRVVAAANRDLGGLVREGTFRQDLFYRLNVVLIQLPPLRDRKEDIPLIVQRLLEELRTPDGRPIRIDHDALRAILAQDWPGNIRQLQNTLEKTALLLDGDTIGVEHLNLDRGAQPAGPSRLFEVPYEQAKDAFVREYLKVMLARNGGNVTHAANEAGLVRSSFHKMLRKHGLASRDFTASRDVAAPE